ncbi:MAG: hypothetical protein V1881_00275 [Candidatus Micrarchaeota archaeon]
MDVPPGVYTHRQLCAKYGVTQHYLRKVLERIDHPPGPIRKDRIKDIIRGLRALKEEPASKGMPTQHAITPDEAAWLVSRADYVIGVLERMKGRHARAMRSGSGADGVLLKMRPYNEERVSIMDALGTFSDALDSKRRTQKKLTAEEEELSAKIRELEKNIK